MNAHLGESPPHPRTPAPPNPAPHYTHPTLYPYPQPPP